MKPIALKTGKSITRFIGRFFELFFLAICLYFISYWILSRITITPERDKYPKTINIYVSSSGVHSDIILPIEHKVFSWSKYLHLEKGFAQDPTRSYISIGWGDKNFFLKTKEWSDLTVSTAVKAFTGMGTGAIRIVQRYPPEKNEAHLIAFKISEKEYYNLVNRIKGEFLFKKGKPSQITKHPYSNLDFFFDSCNSYSLMYTCNSWTNSNLKSADLPYCVWTPFKEGIYAANTK
jgi:uncharacterized protein (TIGR02117 family)